MTYIHQLADWPKFKYDPGSLLNSLSEVMERRGFLIGKLEALGFGDLQDAKVDALTAEAVKSSEIEGEHLDYEEVRSSIARKLGMQTGGVPAGDRRADGVSDIAIDASERWADPLTKARLLKWHKRLFPNGRGPYGPIKAGAWRDESSGQMLVVSGPEGYERIHFEAPAATRMEVEMERFLAWFNSGAEPNGIIRAALAHLWFVTIHPFKDGNGRAGRAILDLALAQSDRREWRCYSVSEQIREERRAYYDALKYAQRGTMDAGEWIEWLLGCLGRSLETAGDRTAAVLARARFWKTHSDAGLNDRQRHVLHRMLGEEWQGKMTSQKWQKITGASPKTATRDMADLVTTGIFYREEGARKNASYNLVKERTFTYKTGKDEADL
jgi:Fic family protein